jgi:hypothetical protein
MGQPVHETVSTTESPTLRDHLRALGDACIGLDVRDSDVLMDIDTPAQMPHGISIAHRRT